MNSFFVGCSCVSPSLAGAGVDAVLSSARMVSSFDSTPARKEPHLEETLDAVGGEAISTGNVRTMQLLPDETNAWLFGGMGLPGRCLHGRGSLDTQSRLSIT